MINLYSERFSTAKGLHWKLERVCENDTALQWLAVFKYDEPTVLFTLANKTPRI